MTDKPRCYNHPPYKETLLIQDGWVIHMRTNPETGLWYASRSPKLKEIKNNMSNDCKQWDSFGEAKRLNWNCEGCKHDPRN